MDTITDVLGNTRAIERRYGDGSFDCPFCCYPVHFPGTACNNPWCNANPIMPVTQALENVRKAEATRKESEDRARNHAAAMARITEGNIARQAARQAIIDKCNEEGYCIACAMKIGAYGKAKYIRHRGQCPNAR